ncbi:MAG: N-acyl amino acid synthase FeeM domain-containing protein [Bryobacteraceae bacterium]
MTNTLEFPDVLRCSLARAAEDMDDVFRLRYMCYRRRGAIADRADGRFSDSFDDLPNQFSFLMRDGEREPLATVRLSVLRPDLGWTESPAERVFGDHPAFQEMARTSLVEASRLCFAHTARRDSFYGLLGNMAALGERFGVEWLTACPRVEHSETYQRLYGFRPMAAPRKYFGVSFETELLGIRLEEIRARAERVGWMRRAWEGARASCTLPHCL